MASRHFATQITIETKNSRFENFHFYSWSVQTTRNFQEIIDTWIGIRMSHGLCLSADIEY